MLLVFITDIPETTSEQSYRLFPNPFSSQACVQSDKAFQNATLKVYNQFGQIEKRVENVSGESETIYRDGLFSGLYFLKIIETGNELNVVTFVILDE